MIDTYEVEKSFKQINEQATLALKKLRNHES